MRVSISSEVAAIIREFERTSTTVANVYVQATVDRYLRDLGSRLARMGFAGSFFLMLSSGGIATVDDVMEFFVAGASAVQLGTVNFYDPTATMRIAEQLPEALAELGAKRITEIVGTLQTS